MSELKVGDTKIYHEDSERYQVKITTITPKKVANEDGLEYVLKILRIEATDRLNPPLPGLEFSVWKSNSTLCYTAWYMYSR